MEQFISVIGMWMQNTAHPYLAYRITDRPLDLGSWGMPVAELTSGLVSLVSISALDVLNPGVRRAQA